jgi:hypothetical protein
MSTLVELRILAKQLGIKGASKANKETLTRMLENHGKPEPIAVIGNVEEVHATITEAKPKKENRVVIAKEDKPAPVEAPAAPAASVEALSETGKQARKPSTWNDFLQSYKKEHNVSLKEAMLQKDAYAAYKAKRG